MESININTEMIIEQQRPDSYNINGKKIDRVEMEKKIDMEGEGKNE